MQKRLFIIGAGALALAAPLFLVSCASDNPSDGGKVQPADEMVKTSFTLSVGLPGGGSTNNAKGHVGTRMSEDVTQVQGTPVFRGIDNISLIPFKVSEEGMGNTVSRNGDKNIVLPNTTVNSLAKDQITGTGNAHVYNDVSVPTGTNAFLFYGKAIDATAGTPITTSSDKFKYGTLKAVGLNDGVPSGITFTPEPIAANPSTTVGEKIAAYLTSIANAKTIDGKAWSAVKADASTGQGKALADLYANFITMTAGSSKNIQLAVQDLYTSLVGLKDQSEDNQAIIKAVETAITASGYASESGGKLTFDTSLNGYPEDNNLPDGAATLEWNGSAFTATTNKSVLYDGTSIAAMSSYVYPANLWYFVNTKIKTDNAERNGDYVNDNTWQTILDKYTNDDASVQASTRSIALKNQIQYAVGRLDTKVTLASTTLKDHTGAVVTPSPDGFPVKSILVGGQKAVDWQFQATTADRATQYTIYDKNVPIGMAAKTDGSAVNHTLVLETIADQPAYMVVELENNTGKDFAGHNGDIIKAGANFYMVAKLDPTNTKGEVTQPTQSGSVKLTKVFQQDYTTVANLTIMENSDTNHDKGLGAAYNVIPDLRTPALSIGMSVDLNWQSGLTFTIGI